MCADWRVYQGQGVTAEARKIGLPPSRGLRALDRPEGYRAEPEVRDAVNVAITLSQPLLVTGQPGTGKTQLAHSVAFELGLNLLVFHTTTAATARDLFYRYDALRRFNDRVTEGKSLPIDEYIEYSALGRAIILASPVTSRPPGLPPELRSGPPRRSVVLIDEIDKAPRDLPNDILHEVDSLSFEVEEAGAAYRFEAEEEFRPILILTSNSEKNLPDAFLRRCVFRHLTFPEKDRLHEIVASRLGPDGVVPAELKAIVEQAITQFLLIRKEQLQKSPATAEFLGWLRVLCERRLSADPAGLGKEDALELTCSILAKNKEDADHLRDYLKRRAGGS